MAGAAPTGRFWRSSRFGVGAAISVGIAVSPDTVDKAVVAAEGAAKAWVRRYVGRTRRTERARYMVTPMDKRIAGRVYMSTRLRPLVGKAYSYKFPK